MSVKSSVVLNIKSFRASTPNPLLSSWRGIASILCPSLSPSFGGKQRNSLSSSEVVQQWLGWNSAAKNHDDAAAAGMGRQVGWLASKCGTESTSSFNCHWLTLFCLLLSLRLCPMPSVTRWWTARCKPVKSCHTAMAGLRYWHHHPPRHYYLLV